MGRYFTSRDKQAFHASSVNYRKAIVISSATKSKTSKMAANISKKLSRISALSCSSYLNFTLRSNSNTFLRPAFYYCYQSSEVHGGSTSRSVPRNGNGRSEGRLHHFKKVLAQFMYGSKELGSDIKRLLTIRRKLKASGKDLDALSLDETLHMNQIERDLLKTFPTLLIFFIPFIGYAVPVVAFMFPKHFLSHHYWLPVQEEKFNKHDSTKRNKHYLPLVREIGRYALQEKNKSSSHEDLLHVSLKTINKEHPTNEELLKSLETFAEDYRLTFNELPKYHLKRLSQAWLIWPWLPRRLLRGNLRRRLTKIRNEDFALKREGLNNLEEKQIRRLCHRRGLDVSHFSSEALKKWLSEWVELSTSVSGEEESFLAHIAVYKTMNYHRKPEEPSPTTS